MPWSPARTIRSRVGAGVAAAALALGGLLAVVPASPASAAPVGCTPDLYFADFAALGTPAAITQRAPDGTQTTITPSAGLDAWSVAVDPADGQLYVFSHDTTVGNHLYTVGGDGTTADLGAIAGLPGGSIYAFAAFDPSGGLWTASSTALYHIDVATMSATSVTLSSPIGGDLAFLGGKLYSSKSSLPANQLSVIDPATGAVTFSNAVPGMVATTSLMAIGGHLYISQLGDIVEVLGFDTPSPTLSPALFNVGSAPRDGASCVTARNPFLSAGDDDFTAAPLTTAGGTTASIYGNDEHDGSAVLASDVTPTVVDAGGLTGATIGPNGAVTVPAGAPVGSYTLTYQLCVTATPTLCDVATIRIAVVAPSATSAGDPTLAKTGVDASPWFAAGSALAAAGMLLVMLIAFRRRRGARF